MRMARTSWSWVLAAAITLVSGTASAQMPVSVATGDGACPAGSRPLSIGDAQREQARICAMLGDWAIARLAGGGSMDGRGYGCQIRASDPRRLGHTLCGNYVIGIPTPPRPPRPQPPAFDPASVPGVYDGVHPHWRDTLTLSPDGTYARGNGDPGRWRIDGNELVLEWQNWGPERVERVGDGVYRRASDGFTITRRRGGVVITPPHPPPPAIDVSRVPGTYHAIHHRWRDTLVISRDGTYRRGSGERGRWRIEGNVLLLEWRGRGTSRLVWTSDGVFRSVGGQFTITRRPEPDRRVRRRHPRG